MTNSLRKHSPEVSFDILLVEDNPGDVRLVEEAFKSAGSETTLHTISNGTTAIELIRNNRNTLPFLPDIALVDLNLPGKDGCEVLKAIRDDPRLGNIPVIMLTSSKTSEDIERCYNAAANAYLTKPADPDEFISQVEEIERFWLKNAQLPPIPQ